jgi:hypothetical protein
MEVIGFREVFRDSQLATSLQHTFLSINNWRRAYFPNLPAERNPASDLRSIMPYLNQLTPTSKKQEKWPAEADHDFLTLW